MQVHIETLTVIEERKYSSSCTVEVTIGKDRRVVQAFAFTGGAEGQEHLTIYGLAVRFQTGAKVWPGSAVYWFKSGNVNNVKPCIDKRGFVNLVGFIEDFRAKPVLSQHNAV